jgi:hypothetical protein
MCGTPTPTATADKKQGSACCSGTTDLPVKTCGRTAPSVAENDTAEDTCDPSTLIPDEGETCDSIRMVAEELEVNGCCAGPKAGCGELPTSTDECSEGCCDDEDIESSEDDHQIGGGCCSSTDSNRVTEGSEPRDTACDSVCCVTPPADSKETAKCRPDLGTAQVGDCPSTSPILTNTGCCSTKVQEEINMPIQTGSECCSKVTGPCESAPAPPFKSDCCSEQPTTTTKGYCSDQISLATTLDETAGCRSNKESMPKPIGNDGCCNSTALATDDKCCPPTKTDLRAPTKSCCASSTSQMKAKTGCCSDRSAPRRRKSSAKPSKVKSVSISK